MIASYAHSSGSIVGAREHQEDAHAFAFVHARKTRPGTTSGELLAVLADGMGGHVAGAHASRTVCRSFPRSYEEASGEPAERLMQALVDSNRSLKEEVSRQSGLEGMGCTVVAAVLGTRGIRWVSVGDSLLYLFRDRRLYQLNENHSLAPVLDLMVESGEIEAEAAHNHPYRHFLRSALTGNVIEHIDLHGEVLALEPDDWIVLASDGLETLTPAEIADLLQGLSGATPNVVVNALIGAVAARNDPGQDNTTVMAVQPCFADATVE